MKFDSRPPLFGKRNVEAADAMPVPIIGKAVEHRTAMLHQAGEVLAVLPGPGETLHAIMTGRYDLMHMIAMLIGQLGKCDRVSIATLSFNGKNLAEMINLLDSGAVGSLTLLCSAFFRDHNRELWDECRSDFRERKCRAAAARSHCKIVTLACADGRRYSLEGSANLRTNSNREQFALTQDAALHDWHVQHIDELVTAHEGEEDKESPG